MIKEYFIDKLFVLIYPSQEIVKNYFLIKYIALSLLSHLGIILPACSLLPGSNAI